ncbi:MAG: hypothetical protein H3C68_07740 [Deltaproteobacteria bacterium]|nr:hypothetical protein [Deltaproteobacteria bacterium]MBZ0220560.1 hypothetical protein [Deltaproteobacteria bacterium]
MSHRIRKELKRLCQCLFYAAAVRVRPAATMNFDSGKMAVGISSELPAESRAARPQEKKGGRALEIVGIIIGSLPIYPEGSNTVSAIEAFVSKLREEAVDFCQRENAAERPAIPCLSRNAKASRSAGLEDLKVMLNLARGNLEEAIPAS